MRTRKTWWVILVVALGIGALPSVNLLSQPPPAQGKVDIGSMAKEIMFLKLEGAQQHLAMWFPFEFFIEANLAAGDKPRDEVEKELKFLKPYHTVIVQCALDRDDGSRVYASKPEVAARAVLKLDSGEEIAPIEKIPPQVASTVEAMKNLMAAEGDEGGANLHILLFPATAKSGKTVIDVTKKGKLTLILKADARFKETVVAWRTPFDALAPVPPCSKCKENVSAKWSYCPWCGAHLDKR